MSTRKIAATTYFWTTRTAKNPDAPIRLINWDPPMTHYGHLELPRQLAAAHFSVVRWLVRP